MLCKPIFTSFFPKNQTQDETFKIKCENLSSNYIWLKRDENNVFWRSSVKTWKHCSCLLYFSCFFNLWSCNYERYVYFVGLLTVYEDSTWWIFQKAIDLSQSCISSRYKSWLFEHFSNTNNLKLRFYNDNVSCDIIDMIYNNMIGRFAPSHIVICDIKHSHNEHYQHKIAFLKLLVF